MHRHLHVEGKVPGPSAERVETGVDLGPRHGCGQDHRLRHQPRHADGGRPDRVERIVHDQLSGPRRIGPECRHRHRKGLHDDDP